VFAGLLALLAAGAAVYASGAGRDLVKSLNIKELRARAAAVAVPDAPPTPSSRPTAVQQWDGLVKLSADDQAALGFRFAPVKAQTEPLRLELTGRTAYNINTITKIRPRFDTRVEKVLVDLGQKITKGQPLVELYSTDLATAKSDFQTRFVQWQHDLKLLNTRQKLVESGAISQQVWVDTQNDEQKSRLDYNLALDKLTVFYEVPRDEIDPLIDRLGEKVIDPRSFGSVTSKARMILRAKTDGYVILRDVVPGNYYESTDVLMEIAPLDHLWVEVNVYELDQDKVRVGQTMEVQFPFLAQKLSGRVDYVASEVSKETRAVKVRATIPNPDGRLKSEMLVKAMLEIPPVPGQTVVPRLAMIAISGGEYVFVRNPPPAGSTPGKRGVDRFSRVKIAVAQENTDHVVVARGLSPGQEVVTNGSLILSQLYEDERVTTTGLPAQ
jgi:cobalt-zinc-cadmium efflux system membrane fusion protein